MISSVLETVVRDERERFNALFAAAEREHPNLQGAEVLSLLGTELDGLLVAVAAIRPERVVAVARAAYEVMLSLLAQELLGSRARIRAVASGWTELLPALAVWVCDAPERMLAAVCNALVNVERTPGARVDDWITAMKTIAASASERAGVGVTEILQIGQVQAWMRGMAHYRSGALTTLETAPTLVAEVALGLTDGRTNVREACARLRADRWWQPGAPRTGANPEVRVMRRVGAFRGFGGQFMQPPTVQPWGEEFMVTSGDDRWLLFADAYGATLHLAGSAGAGTATLAPWKISADGVVSLRGLSARLPELVGFSSASGTPGTLAVTSPTSHAIWLVGVG